MWIQTQLFLWFLLHLPCRTEFEVTPSAVLFSLPITPNPLWMPLQANQSIHNWDLTQYLSTKPRKTGKTFQLNNVSKWSLVTYRNNANRLLFKGKERKYLLIVANANVERAAGSVIPPQQKFQSLQDALQEKQNLLNHPCVVIERINATECSVMEENCDAVTALVLFTAKLWFLQLHWGYSHSLEKTLQWFWSVMLWQVSG